MVTARFADGVQYEAQTWSGLERALRHACVHPSSSRDEFRAEMAERAEVWSGHRIAYGGLGSRRFLAELQRARLLVLEEVAT